MVLPMLALGEAAASAATFGLSTSLQHLVSSRTAHTRPDRLLVTLVRTPLWVLGMLLSIVAFGLHAMALSSGALVVVQPVIVTGVVFAVLFRAALDRRLPSRPEVGWAAFTWAGLAAFLVGAGSPAVAAEIPSHAGLAVTALVALAAGGALIARLRPADTVAKGLWLGATSGVLFGLVAVLLKMTLISASGGLADAVGSWPASVMVASGVSAVLVNQRAYQTTRLSVSMPLLNIVDVLVALGFAAVVFDELPSLAPLALVGQATGLAAMALGVTRLAQLEDDRADPELVPHHQALEEAA